MPRKDKEGSVELTLLLRVVYKPNDMDIVDIEEMLEGVAQTAVNRGELTQGTGLEVVEYDITVRGPDVVEMEDRHLDDISEKLHALEDCAEDIDDTRQRIDRLATDIRNIFNKAGIDV